MICRVAPYVLTAKQRLGACCGKMTRERGRSACVALKQQPINPMKTNPSLNRSLTRLLCAATAAAALSFTHPASVQAVPTTYVYTGHPFTTVSGPYTTSDFVSGMLTLAVPLAPNFNV